MNIYTYIYNNIYIYIYIYIYIIYIYIIYIYIYIYIYISYTIVCIVVCGYSLIAINHQDMHEYISNRFSFNESNIERQYS